jgi:chromosome segregation ATPase
MFAPSIPPSVHAQDFANALVLLNAASNAETVKDHLAQLADKVEAANSAAATAQAVQQALAEATAKAEGIVATAQEIEVRAAALDTREAKIRGREAAVSVREAEVESRTKASLIALDEQIAEKQRTLDGITTQLSALRERL